ncbi:MAG: GNAT family N-acetyltransferase [Oscillospiraceae bacterium]
MNPNYKVITAEIPARGIGYLVLKDGGLLEAGVAELLSAGATQIFAKGPLTEGVHGELQVALSHEMLRMERALAPLPTLSGKLRLEPLTRPMGARYLAIYNESFAQVPNGATQTLADLPRLLSSDVQAGTAFLGTQPVGIYEVDFAEKDLPEIAAIGLLKTMRSKGLGRELLRQTMTLLEGYDRCFLQVATNNEAAFRLYRDEGFVAAGSLGAWYEVTHHVQ